MRGPCSGPTTSIYSTLTTAMHRWHSSSWRPSSGTASNAAMPLRSRPATSGSRDRTRSLRAAPISGTGAHPCGHVHPQHRAAPRHGRRTAGQGSDRDCTGGIHDAKQWRLDHVRQVPELTPLSDTLRRRLSFRCDGRGRAVASWIDADCALLLRETKGGVFGRREYHQVHWPSGAPRCQVLTNDGRKVWTAHDRNVEVRRSRRISQSRGKQIPAHLVSAHRQIAG